MRILVIGGTLFIGKALVKRLLAAGHEITVLHRRAEHPFGKKVHNAKAIEMTPPQFGQPLPGSDLTPFTISPTTGSAALPAIR